jgi:hypothetical protein
MVRPNGQRKAWQISGCAHAAVAQRLIGEGLDRHDAIHAIGMVLAEHIYDVLKTTKSTQDPNARYFTALERLTAEEKPAPRKSCTAYPARLTDCASFWNSRRSEIP